MHASIILDNLRSAHNVGAIFRTAEGAGVTRVLLVGHTPCPLDRFGRTQPEIAKTSLGASTMMSWEYFDTAAAALQAVNETRIIVVEQHERAISYTALPSSESVAFVFGNEVDGVSAPFLAAADAIIEIPMSGAKESLNVATTAGIILFHQRDGC